MASLAGKVAAFSPMKRLAGFDSDPPLQYINQLQSEALQFLGTTSGVKWILTPQYRASAAAWFAADASFLVIIE